jgi:hypothetical protein
MGVSLPWATVGLGDGNGRIWLEFDEGLRPGHVRFLESLFYFFEAIN